MSITISAPNVPQAVAAIKFTNFSITSDGTKGGTKILLNGEPIKDLVCCNFSFYDDSCCGPAVRFSVTTSEKPKPGTMRQMSFWDLCVPEEEHAEAQDKHRAEATLVARADIPVDALPRDVIKAGYKSI